MKQLVDTVICRITQAPVPLCVGINSHVAFCGCAGKKNPCSNINLSLCMKKSHASKYTHLNLNTQLYIKTKIQKSKKILARTNHLDTFPSPYTHQVVHILLVLTDKSTFHFRKTNSRFDSSSLSRVFLHRFNSLPSKYLLI